VGRGPIAGPMVICAVILDPEKITTNNDVYSQITDSKKLTDKKRRELSKFILNEAIAYSIVTVTSKSLDKHGISKSTQDAFYKAVTSFDKVSAQHFLTDAFAIKKLSKDVQTNIIRGDSLSITIGAASIVAKVYRDDLMLGYHAKYPEYGFDKHKGYGTATHILAIKQYGACDIHRKSFEPIKSLITTA
jgi:ribonuclease HII